MYNIYVYFVFINLTNLKIGGVIFRLLIKIIIILFTTHTPHQISEFLLVTLFVIII